MMKRFISQKGASIFELLVSVAIFGILASTAVPQLVNLQRSFGHQSAVKEIEFAIRRTRADGIAHGGRAILTVNSDNHSFTIGIDSAPFSSTLQPDRTISRSVLASGMRIDIPRPIVFDSRGLLIDDVGDPTTINFSLYDDLSTFCQTTVLATGVMQFDCSGAS